MPSKTSSAKLYPLTDDCHHYTHISQAPWDIHKYWHQRRSIFSRYDDGILMTDDAWFGVTPEPVANHVAADLPTALGLSATPDTPLVLLDLFGGAGGNAIAFARAAPPRFARIIAVERSPAVLACGQRNAQVYGVADRVEWVRGDCFAVLRHLRRMCGAEKGPDAEEMEVDSSASSSASESESSSSDDDSEGESEDSSSSSSSSDADSREDDDDDDIDLLGVDLSTISPSQVVLFASPPWGGPGYRHDAVFDLSTMQPYSLAQLWAACWVGDRRLPCALYLPRTADLRQIARLVGDDVDDDAAAIDVVQYCMEGASKALVAYIKGSHRA